jgi:hypothetical protein
MFKLCNSCLGNIIHNFSPQQSSVNSEKNSHLFTTSNENNRLKDIDDQKADISSDPAEYSHSHTTDKEILTVCEQEETNQKVANLSYTDDIYPTLSLFQSSNDTIAKLRKCNTLSIYP